jgi:NAD(P)-dependent dehydrogenase (short-subunit alcohol dehydrogenase family)
VELALRGVEHRLELSKVRRDAQHFGGQHHLVLVGDGLSVVALAIAGLFGEVLALCAKSGLAKVGVIAVAGTKLGGAPGEHCAAALARGLRVGVVERELVGGEYLRRTERVPDAAERRRATDRRVRARAGTRSVDAATLAIRAHVPLEVLSDTIQPFPSFSRIYDAAVMALAWASPTCRGRSRRWTRRCRPCRAEGTPPIGGIMSTTATGTMSVAREPELLGQTVVVIGGSAGIGLETARRARAEGADVIITGRDPERLKRAALDVDAGSTAAFDATDPGSVEQFFNGVRGPIDHVMVTAGGPHYGPLLEMDSAQVRDAISDHVVLGLEVARNAAGKMRPGGTLLLMGGTGGRRISPGLGIASAATAALPPFTAALALELAPVRVNLIAAGFIDTPLSASLLGDGLDARREELRATLPIARVVRPEDVAALAVHLMTNTAITGATYDIDGGQQFVA